MVFAGKWIATIWLGLLAIYCVFALLFSAGGRDLGGAASTLFMWFGAVGSGIAFLYLLQGKPTGRWIGMAVYFVGTVSFLVQSVISKLPVEDHIFFLTVAVGNAFGILALYKAPIKAAS